MIRIFVPLILIFMLLASDSTAQKPILTISWKKIAAIPSSDTNVSSGFAGAINGVNNNVFIVAGGSNFPNGKPWEGGKKFYSDKIFVLEKKDNNFIWNKTVKTVLPEPIAYCGSTSTSAGIVYVGGENEKGNSNKCYLLKWNDEKNKVDIKSLPDLPLALANIAVTNIGSVIYAVGGDEATHSSNDFFSLDLNNGTTAWKILPHLPLALANATAIAQNGKSGKEVFVIGGRSKTPTGISDLHNTTFAFDPQKQQWKKCADISDGAHTTNLSAASGVALDENQILITGGDNGKTFHKIETLISKITTTKSPGEKAKLTEEKNNLSIHHKGFDKGLLLYNSISDAWTKIGGLPFLAHVTTTDVKWKNEIIVSNGEIKPGIRTPDVMMGTVSEIKHERK
jgi:N-acetylneuraminate epimerase